MIDYLLLILIVAAIIQPTSHGRAAACTFAGLTVAFDLISVPDDFYHLAAATTDGVCVLILSALYKHTGIVKDLQRLCLLSISINFAGWVCYEMYLPSIPYNLAFIFFYIIAIASLVIRRIVYAHGSTANHSTWIPLYFHQSFISDREHEGTKEPR